MSTDSSTANSTETEVPCTLDTCPLSEAIITYQPNIGGNAFFFALFGLLFLVQLRLGIRYKTWSYLVAMLFGLILEVVGYIGRLQLHNDPFNFNFFLEYLVCLTIGPAFLTAAIYITFARVVYSCDERLSWIRPKIISIIFMTCDFICLVLQATGGAITSTSGGMSREAEGMRQTGVNIMIGGLSFQVVSLFLFILYAVIYAWRWNAATALHYHQRPPKGQMRRSLVFGLAIASVTIFVRCAFRVAELSRGFQSPLANNEVAFMTLEGTVVLIACLCLTLGHPGLCLDIAWKLPGQVPRKRQYAVSNVDLENIHTRE
ncbi:putative RTA1 domain protein [Thozetella sp. PMI_491]|nr:putative RTA1 domain protein [Thozetella sp. PMI_491]